MNWNNYSNWHIDHIISLSSFDLEDEQQQRLAVHYTNLQPMWWFENLSKGKKIIMYELSNKSIIIAPKDTTEIFSKLKSLLPVFLLTGSLTFAVYVYEKITNSFIDLAANIILIINPLLFMYSKNNLFL